MTTKRHKVTKNKCSMTKNRNKETTMRCKTDKKKTAKRCKNDDVEEHKEIQHENDSNQL